MNDASLSVCVQEDMPCGVASQISPSGMTLAGKYGLGHHSHSADVDARLMALPTQGGFARTRRKKAGTTVRRADGACLLSGTCRNQ